MNLRPLKQTLKEHQTIIGLMMFAVIETQLDITFATSVISRHAKISGKSDMKVIKIILRYLSVIKVRGIKFDKKICSYAKYSDSD